MCKTTTVPDVVTAAQHDPEPVKFVMPPQGSHADRPQAERDRRTGGVGVEYRNAVQPTPGSVERGEEKRGAHLARLAPGVANLQHGEVTRSGESTMAQPET
jgi:hypothetical protein